MASPINARGAVDLGALATQRQQQAKAQAAMASAPEGVIIDVTEETFDAQVVQRSLTVPVIVDLWAEWCGPCKQLSPVLELVVASYGGRVVLAKVDVDANPRISAMFQVQSIPSVVAVVKGQAVPLFQGALPEAQVRQVVEQLIAVAEREGVAGSVTGEQASAAPAEPPMDPRFEAAYAAIEAGDWAGAATAYRRMLDDNPSDLDAQAGLALVGLYQRATEAAPAGTPVAGDVDGQLAAADAEALAGQWTSAFARLVDVVRTNAGADRDRARERLLELFLIAGDDPAVAPARLALANALF